LYPDTNTHQITVVLLFNEGHCQINKLAAISVVIFNKPQSYSPRADDEFGEGILGNQKFKKMYYLNVCESGIDSR
jgi:hypothetical protein